MRGPATRTIDLRGRLLLPGLIDAHTHFGNAATWLFDVGLYEERDRDAVLAKIASHATRIPDGLWIRGGDIGAVAAWEADASRRPRPALPPIDRRALDAVSSRHPILLRRIDGALVANSLALERARIGREDPDPRGGHVERDDRHEPTGVLTGRAAEVVAALVPPMTREWQLAGARVALDDLARSGITSIHDVARDDAISQRQIFHTDVERSQTDVEIFRELQRRGELTVRVYAFLTLALWRDVAERYRPQEEDGLIRYGALKAFIDGFFMEEPYRDRPGYRGSLTFRVVDEATMAANVAGADAAGFDPVIHTIGDRAHRLLLDWYEAAIAANARRDRRLRVIHAWYPSAREIERIGRLGLIVDVTPAHCERDVPAVERKLGTERARTAHPWRSFIEAGARLDLVSDWPGSYNEKRAIPLAPLENIALAVGRTWHPEQALTVEEAVAAYTANPAYASYEEDRKGRIAPGLLADLVVVSRDILAAPTKEIRDARVDMTILGGRVIFERGG